MTRQHLVVNPADLPADTEVPVYDSATDTWSHVAQSALVAAAPTHASTTGQTANDHHTQSHDHSAAGDGTALVPASISADKHLFTGVSAHTLTADTNNLAISATASQITLTSTGGPWSLSGMTNGAIGRLVYIQNFGGTVTLLENDAGSTAGNRFGADGGVDIVVPQYATVLLLYMADAVAVNFWRVLGVVRPHDHSAAGDGTALVPATLTLPSTATPAQTAEGSIVWDSDDDKLTIGDGASRATFVPQVTGSWTPGISFGGGSTGVTYGTQTGTYVKVGNKVYCGFLLVLTSKGSSTGTALITGLPFTSLNSTSRGTGACGYIAGFGSLTAMPSLLVDQNATTVGLWQLNAADGTATYSFGLDNGYCTDTTTLYGSFTYEV